MSRRTRLPCRSARVWSRGHRRAARMVRRLDGKPAFDGSPARATAPRARPEPRRGESGLCRAPRHLPARARRRTGRDRPGWRPARRPGGPRAVGVTWARASSCPGRSDDGPAGARLQVSVDPGLGRLLHDHTADDLARATSRQPRVVAAGGHRGPLRRRRPDRTPRRRGRGPRSSASGVAAARICR